MANISGSYILLVLALIILITKATSALCSWHAVVGPDAEKMFADVGCQGRISEGGVLRNTVFYQTLESGQLNIPEPRPLPINDLIISEDWNPVLSHYFVGDDAFSLTPTG